MLVSVPDGAVVPTNSVNLSWTLPGGWGNGCPTSRYTVLQYKLASAGSCAGGGWSTHYISTGSFANSYTSDTISGLQFGRDYCWRVRKYNGALGRAGGPWMFSTGQPPTLNSAGFVAGTINNCSIGQPLSGNLTGQPNDANINNPVTYELDFSYPPASIAFIREVKIAFVSDDFLAGYPNSGRVTNGNDSLLYIEGLEPELHDPVNYRNVGFRINNLDTTPTFYTVDNNSSPYYGGGATSGDLTAAAGLASIRNIGTDSVVTSTGPNSYNLRLSVEFNSIFASTDLGIYVAVVGETASGNPVSHINRQDRGSYSGNLLFERTDDWGTDMVSPSLSIGAPVFSMGNNFSVNWDVSDNSTINDVRSYCYFANPMNAVIRDNVVSNNISLDGTVKQFNDPDHCLVNTPGVHNRNYSLVSGSLGSDIVFGLYAQDNACNISETSITGNVPNPWIATADQTVSVAGGFLGVEVPNSTTNLTDIMFNLTGNSYLSKYELISGNASLPVPTNRSSSVQTYTTSYNNLQLKPIDFGYPDWYDFSYDTATSEVTVADTTSNNISGNLSTAYGISAGSSYYVRHTGNLNVGSGSVCDADVLIFVEGNLNIEPDFTRLTSDACMFIVRGDITIGAGSHKSNGVPPTGVANHDIIQAMIVTDGTLNVPADPPLSGPVADALYINGAVYADQVDFDRLLGLGQTSIQPAELIEYDPIFVYTFRDILSATEFSLREF